MFSSLRMSAITIALSLVGTLAIPQAYAASIPETRDPIKLTLNEWTGQHVTTKIAGIILERMGYKVEYVTAGYLPQFTALSDGTADAALEIWLSNIGETWPKAKESGKVVEVGDLGLKAREGWLYPTYMKNICPGLPNWEALKSDACVQALATADTLPSGRILDYPPDWGSHSDKMIKGLDLQLQAVSAGSEGALVSELKAAELKKTPIVAMFWSPHWLFYQLDLEWVEMPKYEPACMDDPKWGPNPNEVGDCALPNSKIIKVAWSGMEKKWPAAYRFLQNYQMPAEEQIPMIAAVDVDNQTLDEVAQAWVEKNKDTWQKWVDAAAK